MNAIKQERERLGLKVAVVARRAEVSMETWRRIERGHDCKQGTKRKVLKALRVPFSKSGEFFPMERIWSGKKKPSGALTGACR